MAIHYSSDTVITAEQLSELFKKSGMRRPVDDLPRLQRMIDAADLLVTAWDGGQLVGVARSLTDFSYCCYLSDLAVHHGYQMQGIGSELIQLVQTAIGEECSLLLISAPTAMSFYEKIGLEPIKSAWMIQRVK